MTLLDLPQVPLTLTHSQADQDPDTQGEVLSVAGYMDIFTLPMLQPALLAAAEQPGRPKSGPLTVDLSCVRFIDGAGFALLLRVRDRMEAQSRALTIRLRPGSQPETVFRASNRAGLLNAAYEPAA